MRGRKISLLYVKEDDDVVLADVHHAAIYLNPLRVVQRMHYYVTRAQYRNKVMVFAQHIKWAGIVSR